MARVPIIAVTANALPEDRLRFSEAGMDGVIVKPVRITTVLGDVQAFLAVRRSMATLSFPRQLMIRGDFSLCDVLLLMIMRVGF